MFAVSLNVPSFSNAVVNRGRSLISTSIAGGIWFSARVSTSRWPAKVDDKPVERLDRGHDVVPLGIQHADEVVQSGEQIADVALPTVHRGAEVVDDIADLSQTAAVYHGCERGQRLLGGRIGRGVVQRDRRARRQFAARGLAHRRVDRQMHRAEQAGLTDARNRIGGNVHEPGFTENSTSARQFLTDNLRTLPTTTSFIITGEFGSSIATFAIST